MTLTFRNTGRDPISIDPPGKSSSEPLFRLIDQESFDSLVFRNATPDLSGQPIVLGPGQSTHCALSFKDVIHLESPGAYRLCAEYTWNRGDFVARSNPVALEIQSIEVIASAYAGAHLIHPGQFPIYWSAPHRKHARLNRAAITQAAPPRFSAIQEIGKFPADTEPILAIQTAPSPAAEDLLVWLQKNVLHCARVDGRGSLSMTNSFRLPDLPLSMLGAPIVQSDGTTELIIWLGTEDASDSKMQLACIEPNGNLAAGASIRLGPGSPPTWARALPGPGRHKSLYMAWQRSDKVELAAYRWQNRQFASPHLQSSFAGKLIAADLRLDRQGAAHGALLIASPERPGCILVTRWSESPDAPPVFTDPLLLPLDGSSIEASHLAIDPGGAVCGLLKSGGAWVWFHGERISAPDKPLDTLNAQAALFFAGERQPVIVFPHPLHGFEIVQFDKSISGEQPHD